MDEDNDGFVVKGKFLKDAHYHAHWPWIFESQSGMSFNPFNFSAIFRSIGKWLGIGLLLALAWGAFEIGLTVLRYVATLISGMTIGEFATLVGVFFLTLLLSILTWAFVLGEDD